MQLFYRIVGMIMLQEMFVQGINTESCKAAILSIVYEGSNHEDSQNKLILTKQMEI